MRGITPQVVMKALPEIGEIKDPKLRKQVLSVWVRALKESAWDKPGQIPFSPGGPQQLAKYSLIDHTRCVTRTGMALANNLVQIHGVKLSLDTVIAGGLLHDVGKALVAERRGKEVVISERGKGLTHILLGSMIASEEGMPDDIIHIIFAHTIPYITRKQPVTPRTVEGVIVHYADFSSGDSLFFVGKVGLLADAVAPMWSKTG